MPRRKLISLVAVWIGLVVALLPVFFQWQPTAVSGGRAGRLRLDSAYLLAALLAFLLYRLERKRGSRQRAFALVLLVVLATLWTNSVHRYYVDKGSVRAEQSNFAWQVEIQREVMRLSPSVAPHSYRFLPNSLVRWLELAGFDYESARDIYRLFLNLLLFYALLRYALLFTDDTGALLALLLVAAVYPVSFEYYSGQLTDPLSHLSFLLAFIFLETEEFAFFLTALVIGSLAKETVLALAGYYVLFQRRESHYLPKALLACGASAAAYLGVRALVVHGAGSYRYEQVSGVSPAHALANWQGGRWQALFALTALALVPFLIVAWKTTPASLKRLALYLLPVLFVSSLFFGWLFEARNYMPLFFVLAVVAGRYLSTLTRASGPEKAA
ncbi:MAG TPA: hypothetical protein VKX25_11160 [Bryobacteraceae bacterium]|nr:hypothetical protein [Bryobacteraceae bacterium]